MRLRRFFIAIFGAALFASFGVPATAAPFLNTLGGSDTASFTVDTFVNPLAPQPDGVLVSNVAVTVNGLTNIREVGLGAQLAGGVLIIGDTPFDLAGPISHTGPETRPSLLTGNFQLVGIADPSLQFSLPIVDLNVVAGVPEPSTSLMPIISFAILGAGIRMASGPVVGRRASPGRPAMRPDP